MNPIVLRLATYHYSQWTEEEEEWHLLYMKEHDRHAQRDVMDEARYV